MGLDMYLYLRKHESCSQWSTKNFEEEKKRFYPEELKELGENIAKNNFMSKNTEYQVAYWRKANQIHKYFVKKCADGVDDCSPVYVALEDLKELVSLCREVIEHPKRAKAKLPTQDGFFFGSVEYDEYYEQELEYTVEQLEPIIKFLESEKGSDYDAIYRASW
jgi:hypothetical protein